MNKEAYISVFLVGIVLSLFSLGYAAVFNTEIEGDFDEGTYDKTYYNSSYVQLNLTYNNGTYTSKIFDAGFYAVWNNISWIEANINETITNLSLQVRASDDNSSLGDYIGSDGTSSSYYYNGSVLKNFSLTGRYFQYKFYFETNDSNMSSLLYNVSIGAENLSSSLNVSLNSPINDTSYTSTNNVTFSYSVASVLSVSNCSFILDNAIDTTVTNVGVGSTHTFNETGMGNNNYTWSVNCTDVDNFANASETRDFEVAYEVDEEEDDDDSGSSTTTIGANRNTQQTSSVEDDDLDVNETEDNETETQETLPTFETQNSEGDFLSGFFTGFASLGTKFGDFTVDNLFPVLMLGLIIGFVCIRAVEKEGLLYEKNKKPQTTLKKFKNNKIKPVKKQKISFFSKLFSKSNKNQNKKKKITKNRNKSINKVKKNSDEASKLYKDLEDLENK